MPLDKKLMRFILLLVFYCYWLAWRENWLFQKRTISPSTKMNENADEYRIENKKEFMERMKQRMEQRKQLVREKCKKFGQPISPVNNMQFFPVSSHKFLFCCVPKTGTTNWKKVIFHLLNVVLPKGVNPDEVENEYSEHGVVLPPGSGEYLKLMVVREPFTRLVSGFCNKVKENKGRSMEAFGKISDTFEDFIQNVLQTGDDMTEVKPSLRVNRHWMTFNSLCDPCHIDYDVIGKLETIQEDSRYVLELLNAAHYIEYGKGYGENGASQSNQDKVSDYIATVKPSLLKQLYQKFKDDYEMFGYPPPNI